METETVMWLALLSPIFLYVAVRLASAAYFKSKRQYESENPK